MAVLYCLQVVLEVLKGDKALAQICREHEVAADLVCLAGQAVPDHREHL